MKEPYDHTAIYSFLLQMLTKKLTDVLRTVQIRDRDRDSQNMQDVMVFESADNDS